MCFLASRSRNIPFQRNSLGAAFRKIARAFSIEFRSVVGGVFPFCLFVPEFLINALESGEPVYTITKPERDFPFRSDFKSNDFYNNIFTVVSDANKFDDRPLERRTAFFASI